MNEKEFVRLCETIKTAISNIHNKDDQSLYKNGSFMPELTLMTSISELIDLSDGRVMTDKEEMVECFNLMFDICSKIKMHAGLLSHHESEYHEALKIPTNYEEITRTSQMCAFETNRLNSFYNSALETIEKTLSLGHTK